MPKLSESVFKVNLNGAEWARLEGLIEDKLQKFIVNGPDSS